ncbi:MAG: hypothetical protein JSW71_03830 [Gemmatimonadota bacterium]|nr:MAG: hypothetical protein JSW71_03830 [Gemmatimonadota bacterium]
MGLISIAFQPSKERVVLTGRGDLVAADITETLARLYDDSQFRTGMSTLADFRGARAAVSGDNIRTIMNFVSRNLEWRGKGNCAVVTDRQVDYGMARMAQAYMEPIGIEAMVFREMEDAERWLGAPSNEARDKLEPGGE